MPRGSRLTLWLALFALLTPGLLRASTKAARKPAGKKAVSQPVEAPRPPLPQELPPVAPTVTYRDGLLTIIAENSTLSDILMGVRKATGAMVDAPASANERVATRLGPGQPRDVLTALLNGSRYDYILLSPAENPGGVRRLILRARTGGDAGPPAESSGGALLPPTAPRPAPGARTLPPDNADDENAQPEETVEPAEEVQPEPQQPPEVKTPEQMQEELRRQQEEQQRQQQQEQPQDQRRQK